MTDAEAPPPAARPVDPAALAHLRRRLSRAAEPPWLHGEVARRMAERLSLIKLTPPRVVDWGAPLGASREPLQRAYPRADLIEVADEPRSMTAAQTAWWQRLWRRPRELHPATDLPPASCELLWSNMALHLEADLEGLMRRWRRTVAVDGFLMFSTLGPGTLQELRDLYAQRRWSPPMAPLVDMHDLGDMLVHAGFADPVMDQETLTLTWPTAEALLAELRALGGNADPHRFGGLRTPRWRHRLVDALEARRGADGRLALRFEIVYGHAFCPAPRPLVAGRTTVSVDDMRAMVRAGRKPPSTSR